VLLGYPPRSEEGNDFRRRAWLPGGRIRSKRFEAILRGTSALVDLVLGQVRTAEKGERTRCMQGRWRALGTWDAEATERYGENGAYPGFRVSDSRILGVGGATRRWWSSNVAPQVRLYRLSGEATLISWGSEGIAGQPCLTSPTYGAGLRVCPLEQLLSGRGFFAPGVLIEDLSARRSISC